MQLQLTTCVGHNPQFACKMDYLTMLAHCCLLVTFPCQIAVVTGIYRENELWMFYVNNGSNIGGNLTHQLRDDKSINVNLSVSRVAMTKSIQRNLLRFCEILTKVKVIALFLPPNFVNRIELTLTAKHLSIPVLDFQKSFDDIRENQVIKLYPSKKDSLPHVMKILRTWSPAALICNKETYDEIKYQNTQRSESDFEFYYLASGLSRKDRIRTVAAILAKIRNLNIKILVVLLDLQDEIDELFTLGRMMHMTGGKYKWILSFQSTQSQVSLPSNTLILQMKNSAAFHYNILLDVVKLVEMGFKSYTNEYPQTSVPFTSCFNTLDPSFGERLFRHMVHQSFVGKTGYLAFDKRGRRINAEYQVINRNNELVTTTLHVSSDFHPASPKKLRAVTALSAPFVYRNKMKEKQLSCGTGLICHVYFVNHTQPFCCKGYIIDMLHVLKTDLAVDIEVHFTKDGRYGSLNGKTNQWDGMIGELVRDEADIAVADLTITDDRSRVVDFTHPFMEIGVGALVRVDLQGLTHGIWAFLQPVAAELWIATFIAISLMGILFWTMERIAIWILDKFSKPNDREKHEIRRNNRNNFSFAASVHYSWSTVVRTRDKVVTPSNTSAKIGAISLALCFLVFITTYTAQLAAFLVAELHVTPITDGIQDSKFQNPSDNFRIATIEGSSTETFFRTSPDLKFIKMWKHMKGNNVPTSEVGVERLKNKQIDVLIGDYNTVVYIASQDPDCSLRVVGKPFFKSGYGIALQKNSNWTSIVTQKLLQYEKFDTFQELAHRWMKTSCDKNVENEDSMNFNTFHRMTAYDVSGMFVVLGVAIGLSWLLLTVEFYYKRGLRDKQ